MLVLTWIKGEPLPGDLVSDILRGLRLKQGHALVGVARHLSRLVPMDDGLQGVGMQNGSEPGLSRERPTHVKALMSTKGGEDEVDQGKIIQKRIPKKQQRLPTTQRGDSNNLLPTIG